MSNANPELYTLAKGVLRYLAGHKTHVSNFHFIPANSMRVQIPAGRMLFHLAKALKAMWSSVTMLFLV
jgi:hypothetical protein